MIVRTLKTTDVAPLFSESCSKEIVKTTDKVGHTLFDTKILSGVSDKVTPEYLRMFASIAHYCLEGTGLARVDGQEHRMQTGTLVAVATPNAIEISAETDMRICTILCDEPVENRMIIRSIEDVIGTERDVAWGNGRSRRMLVERDGMGFAFCLTLGNSNTDSALQYRNHFESCYYVSGSGEYVWDSGRHPIDTGKAESTVFIMNENDAHRMVVYDESICLSIFTPPIKGDETHNLAEGADSSSY